MGRHFKPPVYRAAVAAIPPGRWVEVAKRHPAGWRPIEGALISISDARDAADGGELLIATRRHADGSLRLVVRRSK